MADGRSEGFGATSTADEVLAGSDLGGRVAVVTGASGGLGAETARALASRGCEVVLSARDLAKGRAVADAIRSRTRRDAVHVLPLELSSWKSVREFGRQVRERWPAVDLLIANAGVMACPLARTGEGYELHFASNHLGHFLALRELLPALRAAAPSRVISLSSNAHRFSPVVFDDLHFERRAYDPMQAYAQSKTANALFAVAVDGRLAGDGIRAFAVQPGAIHTDLERHAPWDPEVAKALGLRFKSAAQGAATTCWGATSPSLDDRGALYLEDCGIAEINDDERHVLDGVRSWALDPEAAERLWAVSEELLDVDA